jgi:pimeloyl-ACP methyl ester carboxylesterase
LRPELTARGHASIAIDLPSEDGSATFDDYATVVLAAVPPDASDLVVVGHSLGAMTIPLVAARRPVRALVFLCPVIPSLTGMPWDDGPQMQDGAVYAPLIARDDGSTSWPDLQAARAAFYADCDGEDARWAFEQLRRQNNSGLWAQPYPLTAWPTAAAHVIAGEDDNAINLDWVRHAARRFDVDPVVLPGGHSPFLARPSALADMLDTLVGRG